jgi:hypothetical protein
MIMLERWAIGIVIAFILRQLAKFQKTIEWDKVKSDLAVRVRALVPGTWFDDEAVALCNLVIDRAAEVLAQGDAVEKLLKMLADQKWVEALEALKDLLLGGWVPEGATVKKSPNGVVVSGTSLGAKAYLAVKAS